MYLTLTAGKGTASGTTNGAGFTCIISGIHDILYIDYHADDVELQTVASREINDYIAAFLTNPAILGGLANHSEQKLSVPPQTATGKKFCPQCGASLKHRPEILQQSAVQKSPDPPFFPVCPENKMHIVILRDYYCYQDYSRVPNP